MHTQHRRGMIICAVTMLVVVLCNCLFSSSPQLGPGQWTLTARYKMSDITWSPSGDRIAYLRSAQGIGIVSVKGIQIFDFSPDPLDQAYLKEQEGPPFPNFPGWYYSPRWSPSGREIAFLSRAPSEGYTAEEQSLNYGTLKVFNTLTGEIKTIARKVRCFAWAPELTYVQVREDDTDYDLIVDGRKLDIALQGLPSAFSSDGRVLISRTYARLGRDDPWWHVRWLQKDEIPDLIVSGLDLSKQKVLWHRMIKQEDTDCNPWPGFDWVDVTGEGKVVVISTAGPKAAADLFRPLILLAEQRVSIYSKQRDIHELPSVFPHAMQKGVLFVTSSTPSQASQLVLYRPDENKVEVLEEATGVVDVTPSPDGRLRAVLEENSWGQTKRKKTSDKSYTLRISHLREKG